MEEESNWSKMKGWEKGVAIAGAGLQGIGKSMSRSSDPIIEPGEAGGKQARDTMDKAVEDVKRELSPPMPAPMQQRKDVLAGSRKKGGRINKTGIYRLHKGEFVLNAQTVKRLDKKRGKKRGESRKSGRR